MSEMYNGTAKIPPEKFEFVHSGERIADKKFEDKPIGYFKDAWIRFRKNHASVVATIIIICIVLFAFLTPIFNTRYNARFMDSYYAKKAPRALALRPYGIFDGGTTRTFSEKGLTKAIAIGVGAEDYDGRSVSLGEGLESYYQPMLKIGDPIEKRAGKKITLTFNGKIDTYLEVGFMYLSLEQAEYQRIVQWEKDNNLHVFYPLVENNSYNADAKDANNWYKTKKNVPVRINEKGKAEELTYSPDTVLEDNYKRDAEGNLIFTTTSSGSPEIEDPKFTSTSYLRKIYIEGAINYQRTFNYVHNVGAMILYMQKEQQKNDPVLPYRKQSVVGRVTYSYDNRYFIEGSFGYTGSETFAKKNRFGFFPAVGISYFVSNEKFYPEGLKKVMNNAKIRLSMGRTGNDNTGTDRFLYRATFNTSGHTFNQGIGTSASNGMGAGIYDLRFVNNDIHWEIETKRNVGVDLGFFDNQIELTADYFNNRRKSILLERNTIPGVAGFHAKPWQNYGIVDNWGVDASLNARHDFGKVRVSARGTFTFARNKIIEYDELKQLYDYQRITGTRVNENTLYIAERLYTEDDFIRTQNPNGTYSYELRPGLPTVALQGTLGPGDIKYADLNHDGVIDSNDKKRGVGHPYNPEINYGFGLNVEYKGFYVSAFFQGTGNSSVLLASGNNHFWPFNWYEDKSNYRTLFLDRWTADNPRQDVTMPRLHSHYSHNVNKEPSTWWLRSGNFLRFKNLEIGYNLPKTFLRKIRLDAVRVYMLGNNLCVWDDIEYWDPEQGNRNQGMSYPMSRTFTLGLEVNF